MLQTLRSDRQFRIFFYLILILSLLLPLAVDLSIQFAWLSGAAANVLSRLVTPSSAAGMVFFVFTAFRYPFKDCLPLILPGFLLNLILLISGIFLNMAITWQMILVLLLQTVAYQLLLLLMIGLAAKVLKKEALAALLVFLFWPVIWFFVFGLPFRAFSHVPISFSSLINPSQVLLHLAQFFLYLLIRFFFVLNKKEVLRNAFYTVRNLGT